MPRIAHLSDPHFAAITYSLSQFFSKRWLGNSNLILFRQKTLHQKQLAELPKLLKSFELAAVCITGDLATTSLSEEFEKGADFVRSLKDEGLRVFLLPGNHDFYTKESEKSKRFYTFFPSQSDPFSLKDDRIECHFLGEGWWWVSLDTALATSVIFSNGKFFKEIEDKLYQVLSSIPPNERIIIGNHFPLYKSGSPRHYLWRCGRLQEILKSFPNVKLYLHGHDHSPYQIDKQKEGFPLVFCAGSCSQMPQGFFNTYDLTENDCRFVQYTWNGNDWVENSSKIFSI